MIRVQREDFDVGAELEKLAAGDHGIGGVASFIGLVRDLGGPERVAALSLEHYPGMTERKLAEIEAEANARLKQHEAELRDLGVQNLYLFGSTVRGAAREDSDVDLFFDYEEGKLGLFQLMDIKEHTSRILGCKADIMTRDSLHKVLRR